MAILLLQVKIWFQNHRYKCKRQAKEKAMAEQNQHNQVRGLSVSTRLYAGNPIITQEMFTFHRAGKKDLKEI